MVLYKIKKPAYCHKVLTMILTVAFDFYEKTSEIQQYTEIRKGKHSKQFLLYPGISEER